jgi:hypothetical protein
MALLSLIVRQGTSSPQELGSRSKAGSYSLRIPLGFNKAIQPGPPSSSFYIWKGPERPDRTQVVILVMVVDPSAMKIQATLSDFSTQMTKALQVGKTDWKQDPLQTVRLDGLPAHRIFWSGLDSATDKRVGGILFAVQDGSKFVIVAGQDFLPDHAASLKVLEAAIRTFKKG